MSKPNRWLLALAVASAALAGCGGSSHHSTTTPGHSSGTTAGRSSGGGASVSSGPVRATLRGQNHTPTVKKKWVYTVTATDAQGHPLSGTVLTEFAFQGAVVGRETPPIHKLKDGHLKDVINYPAKSVGYPVELQVVVRTSKGSVTLDWPITVHK
jgi:hypothetical protein